ncbi:MAG TPA: TetR/AcrR family transcriptional regulator [Chloroflexota bacterium]|nr:TetR/AcrR family transcriptional regulator [Chloroflexota bacterium]
MPVGQVNSNDPRVKRTRQLLQQAMLDLMGRKSFQAITVHDIAETATLNRATFYAHFEDKYDLMDSIMRDGFQQALASSVPVTTAFTSAGLSILCRAVFDYLAWLQDHCKPRHHQFEPLLEKAVQDVLQGFIAGWLRQGAPSSSPQGADPDTVATIISWAIFGAGSQWSRGPRAHTADQLAGQVVAVLGGGVFGNGSLGRASAQARTLKG